MSITPLPPKKDSFAALVEKCRRELPSQLEWAGIRAKILRAQYLALVNEGFTPAEALDIVKQGRV